MSDMTRRFEVILTSFSSVKCNGQFKFKIKWLFATSANKLVRARNLCSQTENLHSLLFHNSSKKWGGGGGREGALILNFGQ